jgi:hypothetical protein
MELVLRNAKVTGHSVVTESSCTLLHYFPPTLNPVKSVKIINDEFIVKNVVQWGFLGVRKCSTESPYTFRSVECLVFSSFSQRRKLFRMRGVYFEEFYFNKLRG